MSAVDRAIAVIVARRCVCIRELSPGCASRKFWNRVHYPVEALREAVYQPPTTDFDSEAGGHDRLAISLTLICYALPCGSNGLLIKNNSTPQR